MLGVVNEPDDAQCNDGIECTVDSCDVEAGCESVITAGASCSAGVCTLAGTCVECLVDADCTVNEICTGNACTCAPGSCPACAPGEFNHLQRIEPIGAVSVLGRIGWGAEFGAWVSRSGDRMVVGAPGDAESFIEAGAAFVFELQNGTWVQTAKLTASDARDEPRIHTGSVQWNARFGFPLEIDGDTIAVGAHRADGELADEVEIGAVYVYERDDGEWVETRLDSPRTPFSYFGMLLDLDGDWLMAQRFDSAGETPYRLRVDVWHRVAPHTWEMTQTLDADETEYGPTNLGWYIAIDGNRALITAASAPTYESAVGIHFSVHSFILSGTTWTRDAIFESPTIPHQVDDFFGFDIDLDGTTALIGAPFEVGPGGEADSGMAYVMDLLLGTWSLAEIPNVPVAEGAFLGWNATHDADADALAIGGYPPGGGDGSVHLYAQDGSWTHVGSIPAPAAGENFGFVVRMDGGHLMAGATIAEAAGYDVPPGVVYAYSCSEGGGGPSCTPTGADDTCNNIDDDCDGTIDEGYAGASASCGDGACERSGGYVCVGGAPSLACEPGTQTGSDNNCNGSDEDCDGTVDEGCHCSAVTATAADHVAASRASLCSSTTNRTLISEDFVRGEF
jgi:hypothetical protein